MAATITQSKACPANLEPVGKPAQKPIENRSRIKRERFLRLAPKRVQRALDVLRRVQNVGAKATYIYTPEEAAKIIAALQAVMRDIESAFSSAAVEKQTFSL